MPTPGDRSWSLHARPPSAWWSAARWTSPKGASRSTSRPPAGPSASAVAGIHRRTATSRRRSEARSSLGRGVALGEGEENAAEYCIAGKPADFQVGYDFPGPDLTLDQVMEFYPGSWAQVFLRGRRGARRAVAGASVPLLDAPFSLPPSETESFATVHLVHRYRNRNGGPPSPRVRSAPPPRPRWARPPRQLGALDPRFARVVPVRSCSARCRRS